MKTLAVLVPIYVLVPIFMFVAFVQALPAPRADNHDRHVGRSRSYQIPRWQDWRLTPRNPYAQILNNRLKAANLPPWKPCQHRNCRAHISEDDHWHSPRVLNARGHVVAAVLLRNGYRIQGPQSLHSVEHRLFAHLAEPDKSEGKLVFLASLTRFL